MKRATPLIGLLASLASCAAPRTSAAPSPSATLEVATYNLNYGLAGDTATRDAIGQTEADVILLQEASDGWLAVIDRESHPFVCVARSPFPAGGAAIVSRLPLRDCAVSPSAVGWFPALAATVEGPFGDVRLVNLHLQPARGGAAALIDLPRLPVRHRREVEAHLERLLDASLPSILAGDFNEGDGEGALSELAARGYDSALARHAPSATTWRWPLGAMTLEKRLDHVLYRPGSLRCLSARVLDRGRSDHRPVIARFASPSPPPMPIGTSLMTGQRSALTPR